jgi:mediator of RNA polymerase II transcription subunit 13, fungi type
MTFCVYPYSSGINSHVKTFLSSLASAYETCKLGSHLRGQHLDEYEDGLVPVRVSEGASMKAVYRGIRESCVRLAEALSNVDPESLDNLSPDTAKIGTYVIYIINPFENHTSLWHLCAAFWALFQTYSPSAVTFANSGKLDIVLQIIPIRCVASFGAPVVPDPATMVYIAREVYDRCPPTRNPPDDQTPLSIYRAPAIQLEETLPKTISFKLQSDPPSDLLRENSYMHIGYGISEDLSWLCAAWTDNFGKNQTLASYSLVGRSFSDVAKEVWATTIDIISPRRVAWRVCVAKHGILEKEELEAWVQLATVGKDGYLCTAILSVITNPTVTLTYSPQNAPSLNASTTANISTPVSTPQAGVSPSGTDLPASLTPAATPTPVDAYTQETINDPDARLIDTCDETWGTILGHRLNAAHAMVDFRPALLSALLIKKGSDGIAAALCSENDGLKVEDVPKGPHVICVNLMWLGAVNGNKNTASSTNNNNNNNNASPVSVAMTGDSNGPPTPLSLLPTTPLQNNNNTTNANDKTQQGQPQPSQQPQMWTATAHNRGTAEMLFKDVLPQYRGLGLLAKVRGINKLGLVPWHIEVAGRVVEGLGRLGRELD